MSAIKEQIKEWDLYAITDIAMGGGRSYQEIFESLLESDVKVIQLRDKTSTFDELMKVGPELVRMCHENNAQLIVNDNPYLARDIEADGVHVGQTDFPVDICREIVGDDKIIGLSTHNRAQANRALTLDVDYIGLGPIHETETKKSEHVALGLNMVRWASDKLDIPIVFIGGINLDNLADTLAAGARCCAVVSGIMKSDDIADTAKEYRRVFKMMQSDE